MTTCDYCGHDNQEHEHRCRRCGRRLAGKNVFPAPNPYPATRTSPLRQPAPDQRPGAEAMESGARIRTVPRPVQKPLFSGPVIRFEDIDPSQRAPKKRSKRRRAARPGTARRTVSADQQAFDFEAPIPAPAAPASVEPDVEPALYCAHPVAGATHRVLAASVDLGLILVASSLFAVIFQRISGHIAFDGVTLGVLGGGVLAIGVLYKMLWCLANGDSLGTQVTGLRLLNFDGKRPTRKQRLQRLAGMCLSTGALGLGILWALGDMEKLAWHDHISKTFPSPRP